MASISSCTNHQGVGSSDKRRMHRCIGIGSSGLATPIFYFSLSSLAPKNLRMVILTIILVQVLCCHSITKITQNGINGTMFVTKVYVSNRFLTSKNIAVEQVRPAVLERGCIGRTQRGTTSPLLENERARTAGRVRGGDRGRTGAWPHGP